MNNEKIGELKASFRELFPEYEHGDRSDLMHRYLVAARKTFSGDEVISALEGGRQSELMAAAQRAKRITDLLIAWNENNISVSPSR